MGNVLTGKYQISLSAWNWLIERNNILDFVPIVKDFQIMAVIPSPPEVDPGNKFQVSSLFAFTSKVLSQTYFKDSNNENG